MAQEKQKFLTEVTNLLKQMESLSGDMLFGDVGNAATNLENVRGKKSSLGLLSYLKAKVLLEQAVLELKTAKLLVENGK